MAVDLTANCILQYKFNDQGGGTNVVDSSQAGMDGTITGNTAGGLSVAGKLPEEDPLAFNFPGTNGPPNAYISRGSSLSVSGNYTINFWVYHNDNTNASRYFLGNGADIDSYFYIQDNGSATNIVFGNRTGGSTTWVVGSSIYQSWKMLTFISIADGEQIQLYINNVFQSTKTLTTTFNYSEVGYAGNDLNSLYKGYLDDFRIFDTNITEADRAVLWNNGDGTELMTPGVFLYSVSLNKIVVTTSTVNDPVTFHSMYVADQAGVGTVLLVAESGAADNTLTYPIRPTHDKALKVKCIVAGKSAEADYIFITGTDAWGAVQTEALNVTAGNGIYETTKRFATISNLDCSDNAAGAGTVWDDGTIAVTQDIWGVVWETVKNGQYKIDANIDFGDTATSTYFTTSREQIYQDGWFSIKSNATLRIGVASQNADESGLGSSWKYNPNSNINSLCDGGTLLMYGSLIFSAGAGYNNIASGSTITIYDSILTGDWVSLAGNSGLWVLQSGSSGAIDNVYAHDISYFSIRTSTVTINRLLVDVSNFGIQVLTANPVMTGLLIRNFIISDIKGDSANNIRFIDPLFNITTPLINVPSTTIAQQYTCNIHATDSDGGSLADVDVDCEYAHLVEGSDGKTYKCIADFTATDDEFKPYDGSGDWESKWDEYFVDGVHATGLGGIWQTTYDFKAGDEEFAQQTTDVSGNISEQDIQYKKWVGTSELLEARIHKFTFTHDDYPDDIKKDVIVKAYIVWRKDMGQSTADLTAIAQGVIETNNLDHLLKVDTGVAVDGDLSGHVVAGTVLAHIMASDKDVATSYNCSTDSLEALSIVTSNGTSVPRLNP